MLAINNEPPPRYSLRILLADDSPLQQKYAYALLQREGHVVLVTNNGQEAIEALAKQEFDLVLMDVEMPVMNGLEATCAIRERERRDGGHIPVVAITTVSDREQCFAAGMDGFLAKPLQVAALNETMGQVLGL